MILVPVGIELLRWSVSMERVQGARMNTTMIRIAVFGSLLVLSSARAQDKPPSLRADRWPEQYLRAYSNGTAGAPVAPPRGAGLSSQGAIAPLPASVHSETDFSASDLVVRGAALAAEGELAKAMEFYDQALKIAPRYAEAYRQRSLVLLRLGDSVQAEADYRRFLELDPSAQVRLQEEAVLLQRSGYAATLPRVSPGGGVPEPTMEGRVALADGYYGFARDAFQRGGYGAVQHRAQFAGEILPQARIHRLLAQAALARRDYRTAAVEARAAAAKGPLMDWRALYALYGYNVALYTRQLQALETFVGVNPSFADGRFLLGYQYLILGRAEPAHQQLAIALTLQPNDLVARDILQREGVQIVGSHGGRLSSQPAPPGTQVR